MTRHPFDPNELGRSDAGLDQVAHDLERYAAQTSGEPPVDLAARVRAAVDAQPHARGRIGSLLAAWSGPARAAVGAAAVVLIVAGAVALGQLIERAREQVGATPSPSVTVPPTPTPTPTPSPTPTASPTPSPTLSPPPTPSITPEVTPSDDDFEPETPEPSESDDSGDADNSGPGGGGSDNSGPGGGD